MMLTSFLLNVEAGCFFGALSGYPLGFFFGRRWGLFIAAMVFNVGAVIQVVSSAKTGLGIMYAGRAIVGWGVGVASNLTVCRNGCPVRCVS